MILLEMPSIKKMESLAQSMHECISFAQGALRIGGVDQHTKEYARQILLSDKADYYQDPLGIAPLRQRLSLTLSERYGAKISPQQIFIGHGSLGALTSLLLTLLNTGDEVLLPEPTYPVYTSLVKLAKGIPIFTPTYQLLATKAGQRSTWTFNLELLKSTITNQTKMIILSNPSNPTGVFLSPTELQELSWICENKGIYLIVDEVYDDYVYEGTFTSSTPYAAHSQFIIRLGSFSKNFAMSGWRVGYAVAQPELIAAVGPVQAATISSPTVISQYAALYALEHREYTDHYAATLKKNRDVMCDFFDSLENSSIVTYGRPNAGFYLFFKTEGAESSPLVMDILQRCKVALTPGGDYGPSGKQFIRLCFARDPELITQGIIRLQKYFSAKHQISLFDTPQITATL
jgi:aspartate/methionine/tyrosine aminotransferase